MEVARQAAYQAVRRSNFAIAVEGQENDFNDDEGDLEPDQVVNESSPLALGVLAELQPSHVEAAFGWTTKSSEGRHAIPATVFTEHAFTHNGPNSAQGLSAKIDYLQNDNKVLSIERAVHTQLPSASQSYFYMYMYKLGGAVERLLYSNYMETCRGLQKSLKSHEFPKAVR
jgi:hypothetical protein